jgi:hypothetical protein
LKAARPREETNMKYHHHHIIIITTIIIMQTAGIGAE